MSGPPLLRRPTATYSIVACDAAAGVMGAAVQSHWFAVGTTVLWAEPGVGVAATQSFVNPAYGPRGLELMRRGDAAAGALARLLREDAGRELRQVAFLDVRGRAAAHTGRRCVPAAGHRVGEGYSVQANLMLSARVWPAMAEAFEADRAPLAERLLAALQAAQAEGGDLRGQQSAALCVVRLQSGSRPWEDRLLDLRVDDHPQPLGELERLLRLARAYEHMNRGDLALEREDAGRALSEYGQARSLCPENREMRFWQAVFLANNGRVGEARPLFAELFAEAGNWRVLARRLLRLGLLREPAALPGEEGETARRKA